MNPKFTFHSKNKIELTDDFNFHIKTDEGVLKYYIKAGAVFDGRSGPNFPVSALIPRFGNQSYAMAWLTHDCNFDSHALSFGLSNELFYQMLRWAGISKWRAKLAYMTVNSRIGRKHYNTKQDTQNINKISFEWSAR